MRGVLLPSTPMSIRVAEIGQMAAFVNWPGTLKERVYGMKFD